MLAQYFHGHRTLASDDIGSSNGGEGGAGLVGQFQGMGQGMREARRAAPRPPREHPSTFNDGVVVGMTMVACMPRCAAARGHALGMVPADAVMTRARVARCQADRRCEHRGS